MIVTLFEITLQSRTPITINASSLDEATAQLPAGFYTTFSTLNGGSRVLGLQAHLDRLYLPARKLGLQPSINEMDLRRHLAELAKENLPDETRVRLILTKDKGKVYVGIQPFAPPLREIYVQGVHVVTSNISRSNPRVKGTDFIAKSAEQRKLIRGDVYEILLVHGGSIFEGMTSNFYAVRGGTLITARKGILLGVTRRAVLRLARREGMPIEYRPPRVGEGFDEAFLTSSSRGIVPVVQIDGKPVGQGKVGVWTKRLSLAYQAYVEKRSEKIIP
ncbi:MAG: branched-chain-amino-acid transaminase [Anaerolineales bacterium]